MDIKKEYKKQRDRVLGLVRRYKKRGYYVDIKIPKIHYILYHIYLILSKYK